MFALYLAPVSGAIFALILYLIFVAGLLRGSLSPTIDHFPSATPWDFWWSNARMSGPNFAMLTAQQRQSVRVEQRLLAKISIAYG